MATQLGSDFQNEIIEQIAEEVGRTVQIRNEAAKRLFKLIVDRTPVGDPYASLDFRTTPWQSNPPVGYVPGTLKGNWNVEYDVSADHFDSSVQDITGEQTTARANRIIRVARRTNSIVISNATPYADLIETFGTDEQAGGMLEESVQEFDAIVEQVEQEFKDKKLARDELMQSIYEEMKRLLKK